MSENEADREVYSTMDEKAAAIVNDSRMAGFEEEAIARAFLAELAGQLDVDLAAIADEMSELEVNLSGLPEISTVHSRDQGGSTVITLDAAVTAEAGFTAGGGDRVREVAGEEAILLRLAGGDRGE